MTLATSNSEASIKLKAAGDEDLGFQDLFKKM
jgi:hypothetical protein